MVRKNQEIKACEVRVIGHDGKQLGNLSINDALNLAMSFGMDLVEIAANATPPVVRIVDYKKFLRTRRNESSRQTTVITRKELLKLGSREAPDF
jgi:translation initiation factor IF-3